MCPLLDVRCQLEAVFQERTHHQTHLILRWLTVRPGLDVESLVVDPSRFAKGTDLLIHEVGARSKQDPIFTGPPLLPNTRATRRQAKTILDHHTDPLEAGRVFGRVKPKLAVFSHYPGRSATILPLVRQTYEGPIEFGEDGMTLEVGETITVRR